MGNLSFTIANIDARGFSINLVKRCYHHIRRASRLSVAEYANVRSHCGSSANKGALCLCHATRTG